MHLKPCNVRFDQNKIRQHLATCLEKCQISRFPVLGGRSSVSKQPRMLELHCSCRMPEEKGAEMAECDFCKVWYHRHCMDIPSVVFGEQDIPWKCKKCANSVRIHLQSWCHCFTSQLVYLEVHSFNCLFPYSKLLLELLLVRVCVHPERAVYFSCT